MSIYTNHTLLNLLSYLDKLIIPISNMNINNMNTYLLVLLLFCDFSLACVELNDIV